MNETFHQALEGAGIAADGRATGQIERAAELAIGGLDDGLDQHPAHAAGTACDGNLHVFGAVVASSGG